MNESDVDKNEINLTLNAKLGVNREACFQVEGENLVKELNHFTASQNTDLLVMIHHHYSTLGRVFHPSASKKMTFHTNIPLLVLPEEKVEELQNS